MFWLALHLPLLSLEAFRAALPSAAGARPTALIARHRIVVVDAAAAAAGIRPGMKRATALALAADLLAADAEPARDAAALRAVAHAALAFTPAVTLHDAQTVLLELQSSLRLFGGAAALRQRLLQALAPLGHRVQMAAAPTALGAALLARGWPAGAGDPVLGEHAHRLPALQSRLDAAPAALLWACGAAAPQLGRTDADPDAALQGMGLHVLADLRALPRDGLARRFGQDLLDGLDRAYGDRPDPRRWLEAPATFDGRLELYARAETGEQVLAGAAVLLARLVAWAQARQARVGAFTLRMGHERARQGPVPATELHVELAAPSLDPAHLQLLLRERLGRCRLAAPALDLQLRCRELVTGPAPDGELFPTRASRDEGLLRLLERLRARLGDAQVQRLEPVADHRPERASRSVPAQGVATSGAVAAAAGLAAKKAAAAMPKAPPGGAAALPIHRPAWLLPEPLPLAERGELPLLEGRPLQLVSGPERIEAGWWDGAPAARDYFIALADDGSLVWIWRGRLPAAVGEAAWFLQGRFG